MHKKIRVAFWHIGFVPYRVPLFQQLAAYPDIDLTVYYGTTKEDHRDWTVDFGSGYTYKLLPFLTIPGYPHKLNYTLFPELLRQRYDVIIASENEIGCQLAYLAARWTNVPFMLWSVQIDYQIIRDSAEYTVQGCLQKMLPFLGRKAHKIIFYPFYYGANYVKRHADASLAAGEKTEEHLLGSGAQGRIFRRGGSIDNDAFLQQLQTLDGEKLKQRLGIHGKKIVLSVSYLQKRKGVQYLIDAFLRMKRDDAVLLIVGDGEYKPELLKRVPDKCRDIVFVGHDEQTAQYYAVADIFAMPSFSDPWGLTINEAMLAGLPVITTTNVGAQELIQGNGFLIAPRDSQALQRALQKLLDNAELRAQMGKRSEEIIKPYTIKRTAEVCRTAIYELTIKRN